MKAAWIAAAAALLASAGCEQSGLLGEKRETVAELREPRSDVKIREAHKLAWNDGDDGAALANYDAVRTGSASSGVVRYTDQSELKLGENTMVIVVDRTQKPEEERSVVALPSGSVEGKVAPDAGKKIEIEVRTTRGWLKASNRADDGKPRPVDFKASVTEKGELSVAAKAGEITFVARGIEKKIGPGDAFALPADPQAKPMDESADNRALASAGFQDPPELAQKVWNTGRAAESKSSAEPGVDLFLIREPKDRARVSDDILTVRGELSGRLRAYLMDTEIQANPKGHFELQVRLERGANNLEFRITGPGANDVQYETLTVIRQ